jgi:hypothetical protein
MAGLLSSIANIITLALGSSPQWSGFAYFLIAELGTVITVAAFVLLLLLVSTVAWHSVRPLACEVSASNSQALCFWILEPWVFLTMGAMYRIASAYSFVLWGWATFSGFISIPSR